MPARSGPVFCEGRQGEVRRALQTVDLLLARQPPGHFVGEIAEEHVGQLAQGREGVQVAARVAAGAGHQQVGMLGHGGCGEGFEQRGLAAACVSADEGHGSFAGQRGLRGGGRAGPSSSSRATSASAGLTRRM